MRRPHCHSSVCTPLLLVLLVALSQTGLGQAGSSGLSFLKLGVTGRSDAMGEAMSAASAGGDALHYNPAGLVLHCSNAPGNGITLTYKAWIEGTDLEYLGAYARLDEDQAVGVSLTMVGIPDIEVRDRPGEAIGTFSARSFQVAGSYARLLLSQLSVGISGRYIYEKLFVDQASGFAFDVGVRWKTPVDGLTLGAAGANFGSMSALRTEKSRLPALVRVGPAYSFALEDSKLTATAAFDGLYSLPERRGHALLGAEIAYDRIVALRAGYQLGFTSRGFSAGLGIEYGILDLQYACIPLRNGLGTTSTFTVTLRF
jgi:hypothetical protein